MTVNAPDFDESLSNHSAVEYGGTCHAVVSSVDESGTLTDFTECGVRLGESWDFDDEKDGGQRKDFKDSEMCGDCWPEYIVDR